MNSNLTHCVSTNLGDDCSSEIIIHSVWTHMMLPKTNRDLLLFLNNGGISIGRYVGEDTWIDNNALATEHYLSDSDVGLWMYL